MIESAMLRGIGVLQVDLVLAGGVLVERIFHGDRQCLEHVEGALAEVRRDVRGGQVEIRGTVEGNGCTGVLGQIEELDLGGTEHLVALLPGPFEVAAQDLPGVALERGPVQVHDVAEDGARGLVGRCPRQQFEGAGVGARQHVALLYPAEAVYRRAVELEALVEHGLQFGRGDRHRLVAAQDVGEPEADEAHAALLHCAKYVVLLVPLPLVTCLCHRTSMRETSGGHQWISGRSYAVHSRATASKPRRGMLVLLRRILPGIRSQQPMPTCGAADLESSTDGHTG